MLDDRLRTVAADVGDRDAVRLGRFEVDIVGARGSQANVAKVVRPQRQLIGQLNLVGENELDTRDACSDLVVGRVVIELQFGKQGSQWL